MVNFKHVFWSSSWSIIKKIMIFALWFDTWCGIISPWYELIWLGFILTCWCCLMNWGVIILSHISRGHLNVVVRDQKIIALIFLKFSFKCSRHIIAILRSSRPEVVCKKGVLNHFAKFIGRQLCRSLFFYKKRD